MQVKSDSLALCIKACNQCASACDYCAASCLREKDVGAMSRCIALDMDCADLCRAASSLMARGSDFAQAICVVCADICERCATECEGHAMDHCRDCAVACRQCADECLAIVDKPRQDAMVTSGALGL